MAEKFVRRADVPQDPDREILGAPKEEHASVRLLVEYEEILGPLRRKDGIEAGDWPWTWSSEQALIFVSEWDRPLYVLNAILRDLAFTMVPGSQRTVLQTAATPALREQVERIVSDKGLVVGPVTKVPKGEYSIDLRTFRPLGARSGAVICINEHRFHGLVTNVSRDMRDQLAEIASRYVEEWNRALQGFDHASEFAGEVRN